MKKSNWTVLAIVLVVSAFLLWLWYYLGFNKVDDPLDLVISICWWLLVAALIFLIVKAEERRRRAIRAIYVSDSKLFNVERGYVECADPAARVGIMQDILDNLEYGFGDHEDYPDTDEFACRMVVDTDEYKEKDSDSENEGREWRGSVVRVGTDTRTKFNGSVQLARLVG